MNGATSIADFFRELLHGLSANGTDSADLEVSNIPIGDKRFKIGFEIQINSIEEQDETVDAGKEENHDQT